MYAESDRLPMGSHRPLPTAPRIRPGTATGGLGDRADGIRAGGIRAGAFVGGALILVAGLASGCASKTSTTATPKATPSASVASPTAGAAGAVSLTTPDQIGPLRKAADQSQATDLRNEMQQLGQAVGLSYEDTAAPGRTITVWGGLAPSGAPAPDPKSEFDGIFGQISQQYSTDKLSPRIDVDPGPTGGKAQCVTINGEDDNQTLCAWVSGGAFLEFLFAGPGQDAAGTTVTSMLPAIVHG